MQLLDIVYLFCHSRYEDEEIRYSLRSVAANLDCIRKVWIFGDRPAWLTGDRSLIEHVPHGYIAPLFGYKEPVRNDFLMLFLASLIPGVSYEFLRFSDDYVVLSPMKSEQLCTVRALEDLGDIPVRGQSAWKDQLWRTRT
jgi:Stealth protein CR2, conserved region 2